MVDFSSLKKNNSLDKLKKAASAGGTWSKQDDDRFWKPDIDKAGNGYAVIRFLDAPQVDGEDGLPWVQIFSHGFRGPGGWYIENSLTTFGQADPVSELNSKLWNSGLESNKKIARLQKRKLHYYSNILVVTDPKHPENEGKVFIFKYGQKIFGKIKEKMEPPFVDEVAMNPFDFWKGANFKLKIRGQKMSGFDGKESTVPNYDSSEWEAPSALFGGDDAQIKKVWESSHSLKELIDKKNFKTYDELKARLDKVLGAGGALGMVAEKTRTEADDTPPWEDAPNPSKPRATAENVSLEDDDMQMFKDLLDE